MSREPDTSPQRCEVAVVVPAYNVEAQVADVLASMPLFVAHVIVVDDASTDGTPAIVERAAREDARIRVATHAKNRGVGGAMVTGLRVALELGARIVVKMDADGQMNPARIPDLIRPLIRGEADYAKGNRFRDFQALRQMPWLRRAGNMMMSFVAKAATGYWHCFDPTNGFIAVRREVLAQLPLEEVHRSYYFETSMLGQLYLLGAVVRDVPIPARYGDEESHLSIGRALFEFPVRLVGSLSRRLWLKNFLYDFNMESVYLVAGVPMLLAGAIFGAAKWVHYARLGLGAPTGTVMIAALLVILGFQLVLAAIAIDLQAVPEEPLCPDPLPDPTRSDPQQP